MPDGISGLSGEGCTIRRGSIGQAVRTLQERLNTVDGCGTVAVDGVFGPETETAVKGFQEARGLSVDGVADGGVWAALYKKRKRSSN